MNTQNICVITAWCAAVRLRPVPATLVVVTNTELFGESWNLSCISLRSSLPISAYMWTICKWSVKTFVSHHFKWWTWPRSGQNSTAVWGGGALAKAHLLLSGSSRSASFDDSSSSGFEYSAGSLTSIGRNVSLSHLKIGESTQVSSGHSLYHCPETSFLSSGSPNTTEKHASRHLGTLHAPEPPCEVNLSTRVCTFACHYSVHSGSTRCVFSFGVRTSSIPFASFDSDHLPII